MRAPPSGELPGILAAFLRRPQGGPGIVPPHRIRADERRDSQNITVQGARQSDGSLKAQSISIQPAGATNPRG
jgi:hypothetical protein